MTSRELPLPTRDPLTGGRVVVTRLECPDSGTAIEGRFDLGWIGRLTREQLDFVGLLLRYRANVQKLAAEVGISYNTARNRLDDVVQALGGDVRGAADDPPAPAPARAVPADDVLDLLARGEITHEDALRRLRSRR